MRGDLIVGTHLLEIPPPPRHHTGGKLSPEPREINHNPATASGSLGRQTGEAGAKDGQGRFVAKDTIFLRPGGDFCLGSDSCPVSEVQN